MSKEYSLEVLNERGKTHGDYNKTAETYTNIKRAVYVDSGLSANMVTAIDMICMKLARIVNGDPYEKDHWDDIAGYAKLVSENL